MRKFFIGIMAVFGNSLSIKNKCFFQLQKKAINKDTIYITEYSGPIVFSDRCIIDIAVQRVKYLKNYRVFYNIYNCNRNLLKTVEANNFFHIEDFKKISSLILNSKFGFRYAHSIIPETNKFFEFLIAYNTGSIFYRIGTVGDDGSISWTAFTEYSLKEKKISNFNPIITKSSNIIFSYRLSSDLMYYQVGKILNNKFYFNNYYKFELPIYDSKLIKLKNDFILCYSSKKYCFGSIESNCDIKWSEEINYFEEDYIKDLTYISNSDFLLKIDYENTVETYLIDYYSQKISQTKSKLKINPLFKQPKLVEIDDDNVYVFEVDKPKSKAGGIYSYSFDKISNISSNFILHRMNRCSFII